MPATCYVTGCAVVVSRLSPSFTGTIIDDGILESPTMSTSTSQLPAIDTSLGAPLSKPARTSPSPSNARPRPAHSASHIRKRSVDASEIMSNSPTARRMSMSTTPQDATQQDESVVTRALRQAELVVAGLCATALL